MRTTLTLDDDVAALVKRAMSRQRRGLKEVVNDALRDALSRQPSSPARRVRFETRAVDLGRPRVPSLDNVADVLAIAEGDDHK